MTKTSVLLTSGLLVLSFAGVVCAEYHCPAPDLVKQNEKNVSPWKDDGLFWSIGERNWPYAEQIGFDQVYFYPSDNKIECRYKWLSPKDNKTILWTSVLLNPDANQLVNIPANVAWKKFEKGINCVSGRPETCAFDLKTAK